MTAPESNSEPEVLEEVPCPLCGADGATAVVAAHDRLLRDGRLYTVVRCDSCGLGYVKRRPRPQDIGRHYPPSYSVGGGGWLNDLETSYRRRQQREIVGWLARRRPRRGRLLEVGCGAGDLLVALRADGWRVQGVEPDAAGAARARDDYGLDVASSGFEEVDLPAPAFDAIVFSGVLEHLHDPLGALIRARSLLRPAGLVAVLTVPMPDSWQARAFGARWLALDLPRHLTHFDDRTFGAMAEAAGLRIAGREPYSGRLTASHIAGSLLPSLQKHRLYVDEARGGRPTSLAARLAPLAKRATLLGVTAAARPAGRLEAAAGHPALCSYFLEKDPSTT